MKARRLLMAIAGAAVLWGASDAWGWKWVHSKQFGEVKVWITWNGEPVTGWPYVEYPIMPCMWYPKGLVPLFWHTDLLFKFHCSSVCRWTDTSIYAPYFDGEWMMHPFEEWESLGLDGEGVEIYVPGMNHMETDLFVALDLLEWTEGGGTYELTWDPEPLTYYTFEDGISADLPGVYVSTEPIEWDPGAPPDDPHHGWVSAGWYSGDEVFVSHEFGTMPMPPECPADITGDFVVDVLDLLEVLAAWGPCP